jgi:hypothetical protein
MKRALFMLSCSAYCWLASAASPAQQVRQILSFEPGGNEACAAELHFRFPTEDVAEGRLFGLSCAARDIKIEQSEFAMLSKAMASAGPKEARTYHSLMISFAAFRSSYLKGAATDYGGGNSCAAYLANREAMVNYDFLQIAEGLPKEGLPNFSTKDLSETASAFKQDEAWNRYCNAWVTFAAVRWPQVTATSWRVYLTRRRIKQFGADL